MRKLKPWIVSVPLVFVWACGSPEQATVDQFFRAAKDNDPVTLSYMAAVGPPGEVESWKVVEVTSRTTEPFKLPELLAELKAAEADRNAGLEERKQYFTDNQDALEEIIPNLRDDPEYKARGKMAEIQEEWLRLSEERKEKERVYQEIKRNVDRETSIASKSVVRQIGVGELRGDIAVTQMLVNLKAPDREELPFNVTLRKYDLSEAGSDRVEQARWVVVDIEGATPEAQAAAAEARAAESALKPVAESVSSEAAEEEEVAAARPAPKPAAAPTKPEAKAEEPAEPDPGYLPRELRGLAKVQILNPATKVEGNEVISLIKVRNVSKDWITGFTVTEHWFDQQGNAAGSSSRTHRDRFMPGEVIELELRTRKNDNFFQNTYVFSQANGEVNATVVQSFPSS